MLDPEEVQQIMAGCFKIMMDEIHRYEGTIKQFTGDGGIRGFFKVDSVGDLELKGKTEPQPAYRLVAEHKEIRTRFEAGLARGITELVGRGSEPLVPQSGRSQVQFPKSRRPP